VSKPRRLAVSYSRFSDPKQSHGDSEDRQDRDFRTFCQQHNLTPSGETFVDRGLSGYHGRHRTKGRLGELVAAARDGRFEKGTVIVVEAWDRLGRLQPNKQIRLLEELLETGVDVGVCRLGQTFSLADFGSEKWYTLSAFIALAFSESKQKSERVAAAWKARRDRARAEGKSLPCQPPAWVEVTDYQRGTGGTVRLIPERAAAVRRIFQLAGQGYGTTRIIKQLAAEGVPPFTAGGQGRTISHLSGRWSRSYVYLLLNDRRALGTMQLYDRDGNPDGPPVTGYLPPVVTEEEFLLARAGQARRLGTSKSGRPVTERQSKNVNVFKSLVRHARDGESFLLHDKGPKGGGPVLLSRAGEQGRGRCYTFPYPAFEAAILALLREVDPRDVLPGEKETPSAAEVLRARLAAVRRDIADLQGELKAKFSRSVVAVLHEKEAEEEAVATRLQEELAKAVRPATRAWQELPNLAALVREGGDEARLRLRPVLRRVIDSIWLLTVRRSSFLLAVAQVHFADSDAKRDYLLVYQAAGFRRAGGWRAWSLADAVGDADFDLRVKKDANSLEAVLLGLDLSRVTGG
jgi:DNA invertase Pin-like site-specific DNA recombinase